MSEDFFKTGEGMDALESDPAAPRPVLEQLGPAPFKTKSFPLLGFLATLYEHIASSACASRQETGRERSP